MDKDTVNKLPHGIYRIFWDSGGWSLAAVGSDPEGNRWLAPTNWVGFKADSTDAWDAVKRAQLLVHRGRHWRTINVPRTQKQPFWE